MPWSRFRRASIATAIIGALFFGGAQQTSREQLPPPQPEPVTSVNSQLTELAAYINTLPGADPDYTQLCLTPGATLGIVLFRQVHADPDETEMLRDIRRLGDELYAFHATAVHDELLLMTSMVQEDLASIVGDLSAHRGLRKVYTEGIAGNAIFSTPQDQVYWALGNVLDAGYMEFDAPCRHAVQYGFGTLLRPYLTADDRKDFDKLFARKKPVDMTCWDEIKYYPGATALLALEGKIDEAPLEDEAVHRRALDAYRKGDLTLAFAPREDAMIKRISDNETGIAYAVLGADHALAGEVSCPGYVVMDRDTSGDNLEAWHAAGGRPISLLEVTPRILRDVSEQMAYDTMILRLLHDVVQTGKKYPLMTPDVDELKPK